VSEQFHYQSAFSRNIGWVTETEQEILRSKRVAIAGLGGVGGSHLLTLTRLGIGRFNISDLDIFELANFNRQAGASISHIGRPKVDVLEELALDINSELELQKFPEGINRDNIDRFLDGVDLYLDGLDFFAVEARRRVFAACAERGIPAVTAAPLGMGVALLNFLPGKMTFEEYFQMQGQSEQEQLVRFLIGLSPAMLQVPYLVDGSRVDLENHKGPSTPMACDLCAGMAATHVLKVLLNRGRIPAAPRGVHFDAYRNKLAFTWRPGGNKNPIQRLGMVIARKKLADNLRRGANPVSEERPQTAIARILDLARWAPSGDNTQPWRFEIIDEARFVIHAHDTRDWCVYDLDGRPSQIAVGALLQTLYIAATAEGLEAEFSRRADSPEERPVIDVRLSEKPGLAPHPLLPYIRTRVTQRRSFSSNPLGLREKEALEDAVGAGYRVHWIEGGSSKWQMGKLLFKNAHIRLTIPEAYRVHKEIIQWDAQFSEDRIPDQALGMDAATVKLTKWAMQSWERVRMLNRYFAGTLLPRVQLDLIPALRCAAHFLIVADKPPQTSDDFMDGGRALQRFWLTASSLGLQFQPEMTPLIFSRYAAQGVAFSEDSKAVDSARKVARQLEMTVGEAVAGSAVFMGRVGFGATPPARSVRKPVDALSSPS
jgi:molybdopterin/thiamine biosynthesis adenylyltransferase/nitroreductase